MNYADYVLKSNYIFTGVTTSYTNGAVAVKGNKILAVGSQSEVSPFIGGDTKIIDCKEQLIMPGIIDPHCHFRPAALLDSPYCVFLFGTKSEQECVDRVVEFRKNNPNCDRIFGFGWDVSDWGENATNPTKASLDAAVGDIPVCLQAGLCHFIWCNSKALEESGITKDAQYSFGGFEKDENGEPNGYVIEIEAIEKPVYYGTKTPEHICKEISLAKMMQLNTLGITSIGYIAGEPYPFGDYEEYAAYQALDEQLENGIPLRMNLMPSLGFDGNFDIVKGLREKYASGKVKVCGLKQFFDGIYNMHSAYMLEPYTDEPTTRGRLFYPIETYKEVISKANAEGFCVHVHCEGDAAVRSALDAFEESQKQNPSTEVVNVIEHLYIMSKDDIDRFAKLNVIASVNPAHIKMWEPIIEQYIGKDRLTLSSMHRSLLDASATIAIGSDFPAISPNPLETIYLAVTRCDFDGRPIITPNQSITLGEALRGYTYGSACALHREIELGTLEAGKLADIVVFDGPLFGEASADILQRKVRMTIVDGVVVYEKN